MQIVIYDLANCGRGGPYLMIFRKTEIIAVLMMSANIAPMMGTIRKGLTV